MAMKMALLRLLGGLSLASSLIAAQTQNPATFSVVSNLDGKALAEKVVAALGGEARLRNIRSLRTKITVTQRTVKGEVPMSMVATLVFPDRMHVDMQTPEGAVTYVATANSGFRITGTEAQNLPEDQRRELLLQIRRDIIYLAQRVNDPAFTIKAGSNQPMGDVETTALDLSGPGIALRWFVEPKTGRLVGEAYMVETHGGAFQAQTMFSDWKTVDGVTLPHQHLDERGGITSSWAEYTSIEFNPEISPFLFDRPVPKKSEAGKAPEASPNKK